MSTQVYNSNNFHHEEMQRVGCKRSFRSGDNEVIWDQKRAKAFQQPPPQQFVQHQQPPQHFGGEKRMMQHEDPNTDFKKARFQQQQKGGGGGQNQQSTIDMNYINSQIARVEQNVQESMNILQELYALRDNLQYMQQKSPPSYIC